MPNILTTSKRTRVINAAAAGVTNVIGSSVDMFDFDAVAFVASIGTLTAGQVTNLKAQGSTDNSTWNDIAGAVTPNMADGDSNKMLLLEVYRPQQRYVRCVVQRGTSNAVVDGVVAVQTGFKKPPVTQDAATTSQSLTVVGS